MRARHRTDHGAAAVEFALLAPVLVSLIGGLTDYGLSLRCEGLLAGAVASGAQYAFVVGSSITATAVKQMVQGSSTLTGISATVTGPALYCVSGSPAALVTAIAGQTCSDGTAPGTYVIISATYVYTQLLPQLSTYMNPTLTQTATVRLL